MNFQWVLLVDDDDDDDDDRGRWRPVSTGLRQSLPRTFVLCSQTATDITRPVVMSLAWQGSCRYHITFTTPQSNCHSTGSESHGVSGEQRGLWWSWC